jgi:hypothetical protein
MSRKVRIILAVLLAALVAGPGQAAVIEVLPGTQSLAGINLGNAITGNIDSTNTADRGALRGSCLVRVVSTIGGTPTVTLNLLGSMDGATFYNVAYATAAAPETVTVAAITITTAVTNHYILRPSHPWRYFKTNMSANTNVTLTTDIWCHGAV